MGYLEAIVLGLVQGLTEFLPISSSAHISIVGQLFGTGDPGAAFTAISQIGTELAVVVFFWRDIVRIVKHWCLSLVGRLPRNDPEARLGWLIIIGSVPIAVLGYTLRDLIENDLRNLWITASMLLIFSFVIYFADRMARHVREMRQMTWRDGVVLGFAQAMALVPGVSRSGGTIAIGLFLGFTREAAARYAFLLAIPAVFGSGFYSLTRLEGQEAASWGPTIVATVIAFIVALGVIAWFMRFISKNNFTPFVIYRIALALVLFGLLGFGVIDATA